MGNKGKIQTQIWSEWDLVKMIVELDKVAEALVWDQENMSPGSRDIRHHQRTAQMHIKWRRVQRHGTGMEDYLMYRNLMFCNRINKRNMGSNQIGFRIKRYTDRFDPREILLGKFGIGQDYMMIHV